MLRTRKVKVVIIAGARLYFEPEPGEREAPHVLGLASGGPHQPFECGLGLAPASRVEQPSRVQELGTWGVDGIITDYPTRLRTVMEQRGLKLPKAYSLQG